MKAFRQLLFCSLLVVTSYSCCKVMCEDDGLHISVQNVQAVNTDTIYLIKYKPNTGFTERIDTVKHYATVPTGSTLPSTFRERLDPDTDWKVVIPALNKEYFISNIETAQERCQCEGGKYTTVKKFHLNNAEKEGSSIVLD